MTRNRRRGPRGSKMVSGPEDGPGQIVIMYGVTYVADAEGQLRDASGNVPPDPVERFREIDEAMADSRLAVNPAGNPYSGRPAGGER